jgi:hypothetical protein
MVQVVECLPSKWEALRSIRNRKKYIQMAWCLYVAFVILLYAFNLSGSLTVPSEGTAV